MSLAWKPKPTLPGAASAGTTSRTNTAAKAKAARDAPMVVRDITPPLVADVCMSPQGSRRLPGAASRRGGEVFRESRPAAVLQGASELRARTDLELPEDAAEVSLDRVFGDEERLRDLSIG